jgi:ubiquinone/menaquinone biosynthesis C-methylase UbiE
MATAYDTYDYPSYWEGREYEHKSEVLAIKNLLLKIPKIHTILDIGAGYGRLTPSYNFRAKRIILSDPSSKLLRIARLNFSEQKNIYFLQSSVEKLKYKLKKRNVDLIILVRVLHHLENPRSIFSTVFSLLKSNGYFILEFANKKHLKATFKEFCRGNLTFPLDIFPKDIRSQSSKKRKTLPFLNYHPEVIKQELEECDFEIKEILSVSNIRSSLLKKIIPTSTLLSIEKLLQKPFSLFGFGPSIFILARKKD